MPSHLHLILKLVLYNDTHTSCSTSDHAHSCFDGCCIQVWHLQLSDFLNLSLEIVATFVLFGTPEPDLMLQAFFKQNCSRRSFGNEAETSVCINSDNYRDDHVSLICCSCIELLCKLNDVYTVLSKSRTYGGAGVALPAGICNLIYPVTFFAILGTS